MKKSVLKLLNIFFLLGCWAVIPGCSGSEAGKEDGDEHEHEHHHGSEDGSVEISELQLNTVGINLGKIEKKPVGSGLNVTGTLEVNPSDVADVTPIMNGIISQILVIEGQTVMAGAVVAKIDNYDMSVYQQSYLQAKTKVELAESEYQRQKKLNENGAGIAKNLQNAEIELRGARTELESLASQLRMLGIDPKSVRSGKIQTSVSLKAPISGVVNKINCKVGGPADMTSPLMQITNNNGIYAALQVYEKDLSFIKKGQIVDMTLTNGDGHLAGVVEFVNQTLDPETKAAEVRVRITSERTRMLLPGMAVNATVTADAAMSSVLPEDAVVSNGGKSYIYIVKGTEKEDGKTMYQLIPIEVVTGNTVQGFVEITPVVELPENTMVVTSKAFYIASMANDHGEHNH